MGMYASKRSAAVNHQGVGIIKQQQCRPEKNYSDD